MGSLVELLSVERATEAESYTLAEEDVVGKSSDTAVVDLDLQDEKWSVYLILKGLTRGEG